MSDPERLLSSASDASALERELLSSIQRADPPALAKGEAWTKLSAQIAAVGLATAVHGSAAASTSAGGASAAVGSSLGFGPAALKVLSGKLALGLAVAGTAVAASALWVHSHAPKAAPSTAAKSVVVSAVPAESAAPTAPTAQPSAAPPAPLPSSPALAPVFVRGTSAKPSLEATRSDRLSAESALLTQARAELRRGDPASAQQTLAQLRAKFPKGVLGQEREVLAIEVLAARGNSDAARRRARAFITAYPRSPHNAQLSRFAEAP